jgi:hypothetical protein
MDLPYNGSAILLRVDHVKNKEHKLTLHQEMIFEPNRKTAAWFRVQNLVKNVESGHYI